MEMNYVNLMTSNYGTKNQESKVKKVAPSVAAGIGGVALGTMAKGGINAVAKIPNKHIMNTIQNVCAEHADSFERVSDVINQTLKNKGVLEKGVRILDASTPEGAEAVTRVMSEELKGHKIFERIPESARELASEIFSSIFSSGQNAAYLPHTKTVVLSGEKMGLTAFHEAGHAINANASKIGKALQACRGTSLLSIPISLIAVLKRPKMEGEKPEGAVDKATTFVKKHAGKLTFATFLPMLIEEGMASIRGCKMAKLVSPEIFKATCKVNGLAYLTYLGVALAAGIGVAVARNIRDKIAINSMKKKQAKAQEQLAQLQAQQYKQNMNNFYIPSDYKIS